MTSLRRWCRVAVVGADGASVTEVILEGTGPPDLAAVEEVARLALLARRLGATVGISEVSPPLGELLDLAGLGVEVEGQPERGEEPLGVEIVEEEVHPGDPPT
jgi:hypothetical protein